MPRAQRGIRPVGAIVASALALLVLPTAPWAASAEAAPRRPAPRAVDVDYRAVAGKGAGYRLTDSAGNRVEMTLKGYPSVAPVVTPQGARFDVAPGVTVTDETLANGVKETITFASRPPARLRFSYDAPGYVLRESAGGLVFEKPGAPSIVVPRPTAWDGRGGAIAATVRRHGNEIAVHLDDAALAQAALPITVDPTGVTETCAVTTDGPVRCHFGSAGAPHALDGPYRRTLFQTADGRMVFFFRAPGTAGTWHLAYEIYRTRADGTSGWDPRVLLTDQSLSPNTDVAVTQRPNGDFVATYAVVGASTSSVAVRVLQLGPQGLVAQPQAVAGSVNNASWLNLSIVDYAADTATSRTVVGYLGSIAGQPAYVTSISDNGGPFSAAGATAQPLPCEAGATRGLLAVQPVPNSTSSRAVCITDPGAEAPLNWRVLTGGVWGSPAPLPFGLHATADLPATVSTDDGRLHVVASPQQFDQRVTYTALAPGGVTWSAARDLGPGKSPTISTTGTSLHVFAQDEFSEVESLIREYVATDGQTFHAGSPLSGRKFSRVVDYNEGWNFDDSGSDDVLFTLNDSTKTIGNRVGTQDAHHRLDRPDKRLSFSFVVPRSGLNDPGIYVDSASVVASWVGNPTYRMGIQADVAGRPSGRWLNEVMVGGSVVSGAFGSLSQPSSGTDSSVTFAPTHLVAGARYHVVVETPSSSIGPNAWRYAEIVATGVDPGAEAGMTVLDQSWGVWSTALRQVPVLTLSSGATRVFSQRVMAGFGAWASRYSVPGQSFVAESAMAPTRARVLLGSEGAPQTRPVLRLLTETGTELWSAVIANPVSGWNAVTVPAVSLAAGARYRLVLEDAAAAWPSYWYLRTSGTFEDSWGGITSRSTYAPDRKGFNDRTTAAERDVNWVTAFNSGPGDAVYVADSEPFDRIAYSGTYGDGDNQAALSYWNGSTWAPLTTASHSLFDWWHGHTTFAPPPDWRSSTVDGTDGYWVRITRPAASSDTLYIERLTSIHNNAEPATAPNASGHIPLAWLHRDTSTVTVVGYDADPPSLSSSTPRAFDDIMLSPPSASAAWTDSSGVVTDSLTLAIDRAPVTTTRTGATATGPLPLLAPGIHVLGLGAVDGAGNARTADRLFTVLQVSGSAASASLRGRTIPVNPSGGVPPATLTFAAPLVDVPPTTDQANASTRTGTGSFRRAFDFGQVEVEFDDGAGARQRVAVSVPAATAAHNVAVLSPFAGPRTAAIPAHTATLADVTVSVPIGFGGSGSTANLIPKAVPLAPAVTSGRDSPFDDLPLRVLPVTGKLGICAAGDPGGTTVSCSSQDFTSTASVVVDGQQYPVPVSLDPQADHSARDTVAPDCVGCDSPAPIRPVAAATAFDCPTFTPTQGSRYNLCTGGLNTEGKGAPWSGYLNAWVYSESAGGRHPLWQQNHAEAPPQGGDCPDGWSGTARARTYSLVNMVQSADGQGAAIVGGTWDDEHNRNAANQIVYLGTITGNDRASSRDDSITFQLANTADRLAIANTGAYSVSAAGLVATNQWAASPNDVNAVSSPAAGRDSSVQLFTGVEFRTPVTPAPQSPYNLTASMAYTFLLNLENCTKESS